MEKRERERESETGSGGEERSVSSSRLANTPRRRGELSRAFGRVAEFVLHRGHRDITRVTLAGADRDVRRCLCIAGAEALHLALSCERISCLARAPASPHLSHSFSRPPTLLRSDSLSFLLAFFVRISVRNRSAKISSR